MLATIGWILFRAESISQAWEYITLIPHPGTLYTKELVSALLLSLGMLVMEWLHRSRQHGLDLRSRSHVWHYVLYLVLIAIMFFTYSNSESFIYFQF